MAAIAANVRKLEQVRQELASNAAARQCIARRIDRGECQRNAGVVNVVHDDVEITATIRDRGRGERTVEPKRLAGRRHSAYRGGRAVRRPRLRRGAGAAAKAFDEEGTVLHCSSISKIDRLGLPHRVDRDGPLSEGGRAAEEPCAGSADRRCRRWRSPR